MQKQNKKLLNRKHTLAAVFLLFMITAALVFIYFTQESKPDPASEAIIRKVTAEQLLKESIGTKNPILKWVAQQTKFDMKDPNELTDPDFAQITELIISEKKLNDIKLLEKFTNLQELSLNSISFPEEHIGLCMTFLTKLGIIDLKKRFRIDLSPLENLSNLHQLFIIKTPIKDIKPLSGLVNLQELHIIGITQVSDLESLRLLNELQILEMQYTQVSDLEPLKKLINISFIDLSGTAISNLEPIKGLINLMDLNISKTMISNLEPIKNLKNLQRLYLRDCLNITDQQVEDLQKALPNLKIYR